MIRRLLLTSLAVLTLGACQHHDTAVPAVLADDTPENLQALKAGLSAATGRAQINLGAGDPTVSSTISVLPPPPTDLETNSPAIPTIFQLFKKDAGCFAVEDGSDALIELPGVTCKPE